ncbi:uncharacterized protein TA09070 [Theileria annulata]|uniref:Spen paralogue and orthologue SPOC C-terminal domain-containing protein n=1 Tax=Theileria annulata TaxID=5874 RepID=Q4U9B3_THEAN|nr:uncharacterized protein TA09070 [Theileria annulata]CAI76590.1 hypothetical protein TA09070 [Theileria annulata]|eukprot:XP_953215.1 hypothetical protein TA09070 [Theileria annulata]
MGFSQPKTKIRLCEQLKIHAPHIFSKPRSPPAEPPPTNQNKVVKPLQPQFIPASPFPPHPPVVPPHRDIVFPPHIPEPPKTATPESIFSKTNLVWQGNIARNGKKITETLAIKISGQCSTFLNSSVEMINITHRLKWEEASKNVPLAVFSIHSSNNLKIEPFKEYIDYFQSKNRVTNFILIGVSPLGNDHNIYICAPGNPLFDKHLPDGLTTPTLIGIVTNAELQTSTQSSGKLQQSNGTVIIYRNFTDDWLSQLNTLTAMVGTKK